MSSIENFYSNLKFNIYHRPEPHKTTLSNLLLSYYFYFLLSGGMNCDDIYSFIMKIVKLQISLSVIL